MNTRFYLAFIKQNNWSTLSNPALLSLIRKDNTKKQRLTNRITRTMSGEIKRNEFDTGNENNLRLAGQSGYKNKFSKGSKRENNSETNTRLCTNKNLLLCCIATGLVRHRTVRATGDKAEPQNYLHFLLIFNHEESTQ